MSTLSKLFKQLGPGLLYAGAAVGVSHIVQSTRAGASYGIAIIVLVLLANIVKYPFFQIGTRYAAVTRKNLVDGYHQLGNGYMVVYGVLTILTMFTIQAAVTSVTAGILQSITGLEWPLWIISGVLLLICSIILLFGRYAFLSNLMKVLMVLLSVTTLIAVLLATTKEVNLADKITSIPMNESKHWVFMVALLGWMPAPLDISVWSSIWSQEKTTANNSVNGLKPALLDFNIGYWGTTFLAMLFVLLGALILYGSNVTFSSSGAGFATQLIEMYQQVLGKWAYPIIAITAFTTMFSTTLTCLDAVPRVGQKYWLAIKPNSSSKLIKRVYQSVLVLLVVGTVVILGCLMDNMLSMVKVATILSFLTAPLIAFMNLRVVQQTKGFPKLQLSKPLLILSYIGLVFLLVFSGVYLWTLIYPS